MPDKNEVLCFLGGVVGGVVVTKLIHPLEDEDRPVIVVSGGSLVVEHEKGWRPRGPDSRRKWLTNHPNGKHVDLFVLELITVAAAPPYAGSEVRITFNDSAGTTALNLVLIRQGNKSVPMLDYEDREPRFDPGNPKKVTIPGSVTITKVEIGGQVLTSDLHSFNVWPLQLPR